jgi:hypothetical protein
MLLCDVTQLGSNMLHHPSEGRNIPLEAGSNALLLEKKHNHAPQQQQQKRGYRVCSSGYAATDTS